MLIQILCGLVLIFWIGFSVWLHKGGDSVIASFAGGLIIMSACIAVGLLLSILVFGILTGFSVLEIV